MNRYEVWTTVWNSNLCIPEWVCIGSFDKYFNASLFAKAYSEHFSSTVEILEFKNSKSQSDSIEFEPIKSIDSTEFPF